MPARSWLSKAGFTRHQCLSSIMDHLPGQLQLRVKLGAIGALSFANSACPYASSWDSFIPVSRGRSRLPGGPKGLVKTRGIVTDSRGLRWNARQTYEGYLPLQLLGLTFVLPAQKHLRHPARHIQQQELVLVRKTILDE